MAVKITVEDKDVGNSRRGYHNTDATITFEYDGNAAWYTRDEEEAIIDELTNKRFQMWHGIKDRLEVRTESKLTVTYLVNYGYDSGD